MVIRPSPILSSLSKIVSPPQSGTTYTVLGSDEFRIFEGDAVYTANFTPPLVEF